ncbi:MAG: pitrilysin family protein [Pseudomonadota bacterium]|nr:pitrilysin family protein [Pseudomonadota bacterium]
MSLQVTKLENGLHIVTDTMESVKSLTVGAWIRVGSRYEAPQLNGISHVLEHMVFKGTTRRSANKIVEDIESVGGHINAYTSRENTAFFAKVLYQDLPLAVDIISDLVCHPTLKQQELEREQDVIEQEINNTKDTPEDLVFDHFQETAFPHQAIGKPVMGTAQLIKNIERKALIGYMNDHYCSERIIMAAAGKVDHETFVHLVKQSFQNTPGTQELCVQPSRYVGGDYRQERAIEQLHLVIGFNGLAHSHPDYYSISLLSILLGGGMSSRLFQEAREKRGLVYNISAFSTSYEDCGLFGIYSASSGSQISELISVICKELTSVCDRISLEELERAKMLLKSSVIMGLESTSSRCESAAQQLQIFGRPLPTNEIIAQIESIPKSSISEVARRLFEKVPTVSAIGPITQLEDYGEIIERLT